MLFDIETTSLSGMDGRVTCIACMDEDDKEEKISILWNEDEKIILETFFKMLCDEELLKNNLVLLGFNIKSFDIPFIVKRAIVNEVFIPESLLKSQIIDLRDICNSYELHFEKQSTATKGTLNEWAKIMGMEEKTEDGLKCIDYFINREWDKLKEHCQYDVEITSELYERLKKIGLIKKY